MTRTVQDAKLESPTARLKLAISPTPHWCAIDPNLYLGYRRGKVGGRWLARWYKSNRKYHSKIIATADDDGPADAVNVLNFVQAQKAVRDAYAAEYALEAEAGPLTVRQAFEAYVKKLREENRSADQAQGRLAKHVLPKIGDKVVAKLARDDMEAVQSGMLRDDPAGEEVARKSKSSANRTMAIVEAALNRAFKDDADKIPSDRAWRLVKPYPKVDAARECFLDPGEQHRLINACGPGAFRNFVTAALLTGARPLKTKPSAIAA